MISAVESRRPAFSLTGPGGTGKTRLALEAAATLVPRTGQASSGSGSPALRDPALVTETISQTLGAKDGLAEHIAERELLLLLDNLEQVIEAAPELAALLGLPQPHPARHQPRAAARAGRGRVPGPPARRARGRRPLLRARAASSRARDRRAMRRLDDLPLAVELAAARTKALSPAQILERLSRRLDLLKGGRDADPRQQTLRATIEWSYDLLSADEQQLFARLSVFAGGCTLDAAEEVCDADLDTLQSLVEKSLLRFTNERYWMLETIREFATERLDGLDVTSEFRRRHAHWYRDLSEAYQAELPGATAARWLIFTSQPRSTTSDQRFRGGSRTMPCWLLRSS